MRVRRSFAVCCTTVLAGGLALAGTLRAQGPAAEMTAEQKAKMEKMMAFATPGEAHKVMAPRAGSWDLKVTFWEEPKSPPQVSNGTSECKPIMDGRYLEETATGNFFGMPFAGKGLSGYDNLKKKYVSTWIDNMGTGVMLSEGTYDAASKTFTYMGEMPDVVKGKYMPAKMTEKWTGPDSYTMEMLAQTPDGKGWWKSMQIDYTRKK